MVKMVKIFGFDYPVPLTFNPFQGYSVCVAHRFFDSPNEHSITKDLCQSLGYSLYVFGHDHVYYPIFESSSYRVVRPGSFMRNTAHQSNLQRDVKVFSLMNDLSLEEDSLHVKPSEEVFSSAVFYKPDVKFSIQEVSKNIEILLQKVSSEGGNASVYTFIDSYEMNPEVRILLCRYLQSFGFYR